MSRTLLHTWKNTKMSEISRRKPTWIGNANSIVEKGKGNYLFKDGNGNGVLNSFSLERFGDSRLEGLDIPAWLEESITIGASPTTNNHVPIATNHSAGNRTAVSKLGSSPSSAYTAGEHSYASNPPPAEEVQHQKGFFDSNNTCSPATPDNDNILPIIDDLLGNSQTYNLDQFMDESPLSSPTPFLPPVHEELGFQNINELLDQHHYSLSGAATINQTADLLTTFGDLPNISQQPANDVTQLLNMISQDMQPNASSLFITSLQQLQPIINSALSPPAVKSDSPMMPSPSNDSGIYSGHSAVSSPASVYAAPSSPQEGSSDVYMLAKEEEGTVQSLAISSTESSPRSSIYDDLNDTTTGRSNLVQLLLGGLSDDDIASDSQIDFNLLNDDLSCTGSRTSICDDEELNRILDGSYAADSSRPRSDSSTSSQSTQSLEFSSDNSSAISIVPSLPNDASANVKASKTKQKRAYSSRKTTEAKNQKRFAPYVLETPTANNVDSNTLDEPIYQGKASGKKVYKSKEAKDRKMSQNRTAAHRYRQKKKGELSEMEKEADELEETNGQLRSKVDDMSREIDYLKNLMLDVIKAKLSANSDQEREETMKLLDELTASELPNQKQEVTT